MILAFTSCIDPIRDPVQKGWTEMDRHGPTDLLLLGDNIYMDYGWFGRRRNESPRRLALSDFSARMRDAYERQWQVAAFRRFIDGRTVYTTWDDHDFAWNNARGGALPGNEGHVPNAHRDVARLHFETFREALSASPRAQILPPDPAPGGVPRRRVAASVATTIAMGEGIRMHVLDARTFREQRGGTLLGEAQRLALTAALLPAPGINLLASSSALKEWEDHPIDFGWLTHQARSHRILALSGNEHKPRFRHEGRLYEATASALAQPPGVAALLRGRKTGVFGLLDIDDDWLTVRLFVAGSQVDHRRISRADWSLETLAA
jgi:hypothetical protein